MSKQARVPGGRRSRWPVFLFGLLIGIVVTVAAGLSGGLQQSLAGLPFAKYLRPYVSVQPDETARLRKQVDELRAELDRAKNTTASGKASETSTAPAAPANDDQITRLKGQIKLAEQVTTDLQGRFDKAVKQDIPALKSRIAARDAALAKLDAEVARLSSVERELNALRKADAGKGGSAEAARQALQEELDQARERLKSQSETLAEREAEIKSLKGDLADREDAVSQLDAQQAQLSTLQDENARLRRQVAKADNSGVKKDDSTSALRTELNNSRERIAELEAELESHKGQIEELRNELASRPVAPGADNQGAQSDQSGTRAPTPRDPLLVAGAMHDARGFDKLTNSQRDRIGTGLIEGECVAKVLTDVFGTPPKQALHDLIEALQSDC